MSIQLISKEERKILSTVYDFPMELSFFERELIMIIRQISYGNVSVAIEDGVPERVKKEISSILVPERFKQK